MHSLALLCTVLAHVCLAREPEGAISSRKCGKQRTSANLQEVIKVSGQNSSPMMQKQEWNPISCSEEV